MSDVVVVAKGRRGEVEWRKRKGKEWYDVALCVATSDGESEAVAVKGYRHP